MTLIFSGSSTSWLTVMGAHVMMPEMLHLLNEKHDMCLTKQIVPVQCVDL